MYKCVCVCAFNPGGIRFVKTDGLSSCNDDDVNYVDVGGFV